MLRYFREIFKMGITNMNGTEIAPTATDRVVIDRVQRFLAYQNKGIAIMLGLAVLILAILIIICTIVILRSQRKTRKMLKELIEVQQKQEPEEDKPAGEP